MIALLLIIVLLACSVFCKNEKDFTISLKKECAIWGALLCSLIALCRTFPTPLYFDYMGIIVGILSLLVTLLIGWQIYNAIEINKKLQSIDNVKKSLEATKIILATINYNKVFPPKKCINNYISAIEISLQANDYDNIDFALEQLLSLCLASDIFEIYKGDKNRYIKILKEASSHTYKDIEELIDAIKKAKEVD